MSTPASGSAAYCTGAQFTSFYDWRTVGELLIDSEKQTPLSRSQVEASTVLINLLKAASGEVEAACMVANRYVINSTQNDLSSLTGNSALALAELVADLAMWRAFKRRPLRDPGLKPPTSAEDARLLLDKLRDGERIFGFVDHAQAGLLDSRPETALDVQDRHGIAVQAERLFGLRGNRYTY